MMGPTHVLGGVLAGFGIGWLVDASPSTTLLWGVTVGGAALLPDLDTTRSTATRMWGWVSRLLFWPVRQICGGHRQGSHDLVLAPLAFGILAWLAGMSPWGTAALVSCVTGLCLAGLGSVGLRWLGTVGNLAVSLGVGIYTGLHSLTAPQLPILISLGVIAHLAGDALTRGGLPMPLVWISGTRTRLGAPVLATGGSLETLVAVPALAVACGLLGHYSGLWSGLLRGW